MNNNDLEQSEEHSFLPLAARLRPTSLDHFAGQLHILGEGRPLRQALALGQPHSLILWGPPGTGKTTLALLMAHYLDATFVSISAVLAGVKQIREEVDLARERLRSGKRTLLFVDEVHRFNKGQQDAFLPHIEDGTLVFVGATTENPSFELNNALLSRVRVYRLQPLDETALARVLDQALADSALAGITLPPESRALLLEHADGDARRLLNTLEMAADLARGECDGEVGAPLLWSLFQDSVRQFDKGGDIFHDQISALHKSVRGSDPDAALYWLARMLDGGADPLYVARRVVRMASEDIGNADPRALRLALDAWDVQERLGSPEGELAIAQAVAYLAIAAKSNALYTAWKAAQRWVREHPTDEVPLHLRNAPTKLLKDEGHGADYRYAHDFPDAFVAGENYFPKSWGALEFYQPVPRGLEIRIAEKLQQLRQQNRNSTWKRSNKP